VIVRRSVAIAAWIALTAGLLWPHAGHASGLVEPVIGDRPNLAHWMAFVVLTLLVRQARLFRSTARLCGVLLAYGLVTEAAQLFIPGRTANLGGASANVLGVAAGVFIAWAAARVVQRSKRERDDALDRY
jgi:hypothetical protein